jgi:hypothetical protein
MMLLTHLLHRLKNGRRWHFLASQILVLLLLLFEESLALNQFELCLFTLLFLALFQLDLELSCLFVLLVPHICLALDLNDCVPLTFNELWVSENILYIARTSALLVKIVHVQLSDEWLEVVVSEILGQDHFAELVYVVNYEALTIIQPAYNLSCLWVIYHVIKFHQKWRFFTTILLGTS